MTDDQNHLVPAQSRAIAIPDRPRLPVAVPASNLLINTLGTTILVVTGETGGAGVDTLVACLIALLDEANHPVRVVEVGTRRGYLKATLQPEEYAFANVASPDFVADLLNGVAGAPAGYPIIISVNAAAWKDFVYIEEQLEPWIEKAPERYRVLIKLPEWGTSDRTSGLYKKMNGAGRVIRCFTQHPPSLRGAGAAPLLRHDPDNGIVQVPRLSDRLKDAFYNEERRLSSALNEVPIGDAIVFARAMKLFASGLEDVL